MRIKGKNNTEKSLLVTTAVRAHVIRYNGVKIHSLEVQKKNAEEVFANEGWCLSDTKVVHGFIVT